MLIVDLIAGALIVGMAFVGARVGVAGALVLAAFAGGAVAGALGAPLVLAQGHDSDFALTVAFPAALLAGALAAAVAESRVVALRPRLRRLPAAHAPSAVAAAVLGGLTGAVGVWLLATAAAQYGELREPVAGSTIVSGVEGVLRTPGRKPDAPDRSFDPFPIITAARPRISAVDPDVVNDVDVRAADRSVVQIAVAGCRGGGSGTGWVAAGGIVATNAHVVSGADRVAVRPRGGELRRASVIWFDPVNDVALLRAPSVRAMRPLPIVRSPRSGTAGALIGFPFGRHSIRPARLGPTSDTIRGRMGGPKPGPRFPRRLLGRLVTPFLGRAEPGNSGGPVVDRRGRVLTTVFGGSAVAAFGWGVPNRFVRAALERAGPRVGTGGC